MSPTRRTRRAVLGRAAVAVAGVAGCAGSDAPATGTATPSPDPTGTESTTSADGTTEPAELDLREANVVGVAVDRNPDGHRLDVTLLHDDDGEEGYANWWQVETRAGKHLGRRELLHAHGTREFTRSATVSVPAGTTCVVVRGHDRTHGYGGQAMLVNVDTGAVVAVRQGPERRAMSDRDCP